MLTGVVPPPQQVCEQQNDTQRTFHVSLFPIPTASWGISRNTAGLLAKLAVVPAAMLAV